MNHPGRLRSHRRRKIVEKSSAEPDQGARAWEDISKSEDSMRAQSSLDALHNRIQSSLDELHADLTQLATDLREANQASSKARKDRMQGFKRALRDILQAADKADKEWH
jgi:hypothetical protein